MILSTEGKGFYTTRQGAHRRRDQLEERQMQAEFYKQLSTTMEAFLASEDFKSGVISSTKAGWGGSCYKVELLPNGKWSVLWSNQISNLYETPGVIIALPELDTDEMQEMIDGGGADDEDDFLSMAFENECEDLKEDLRTYFSDKAALN